MTGPLRTLARREDRLASPAGSAEVVGDPPDALRALAGRSGVRLVDPAPLGTDIGVPASYGVRPEDGDVATHGHPG